MTSWQYVPTFGWGQLFAKPFTPTRKQIVTSLQRPTGWADKDKSTSETSTTDFGTEISATIYYASHHQICRNTICVCENPFMFTKTAIDQHHCETNNHIEAHLQLKEVVKPLKEVVKPLNYTKRW